MAINLNDSSFDGSNVAIFNNGTAGIVDHVTLSITKKGNDDKENVLSVNPVGRLRICDLVTR